MWNRCLFSLLLPVVVLTLTLSFEATAQNKNEAQEKSTKQNALPAAKKKNGQRPFHWGSRLSKGQKHEGTEIVAGKDRQLHDRFKA